MESQCKNEDIYLWTQIREGSYEAFTLLYTKHIDGLLQYGYKITSDITLLKDVLQDLFMNFWIKRDTLPEVDQVNYYLIRSFRNNLIRAIKKTNSVDTETLNEWLKEIEIYEDEENEWIIERRKKIAQLIDILPDRQKEVIHLKYYQNFDNKQISEILDINYQSVSNLLFRALNSIREKFAV